MAISANRDYVKGKSGKIIRATGAHLVWLHGAIKKVHVVIIRKRWLSQQVRANGGAQFKNHFLTSYAKVLLPCRTFLALEMGSLRLHIVPTQIVWEVTPPKPEQKEILPFTVVEIRAMLAVVGRDASGQVLDKRMQNISDRNGAILLLLLDTVCAHLNYAVSTISMWIPVLEVFA